ncbi:MAG: hypothetical protein F7C34_04525 [Desulfurococcales archaeon]|nr:hypothetical protein [Desulfurococcales archaeon]
MPTVHLSLPEKVYRELKQKAAELGIQVTDLIKIYINNGLQTGITGAYRPVSDRKIDELAEKIEKLEKEVNATKIYTRGRMREIEDLFTFLQERIDQIEDILGELIKEKKAVARGRVLLSED